MIDLRSPIQHRDGVRPMMLEMGQFIRSVHHKSLAQKAKAVILHVLDEDLVTTRNQECWDKIKKKGKKRRNKIIKKKGKKIRNNIIKKRREEEKREE